jgi:hypothetical protein
VWSMAFPAMDRVHYWQGSSLLLAWIEFITDMDRVYHWHGVSSQGRQKLGWWNPAGPSRANLYLWIDVRNSVQASPAASSGPFSSPANRAGPIG